jgi:hypothetical protein
MSNGNQKITWHDVVDALNADTDNSEMLLRSISASEEPPRSPIALYLAAQHDLAAQGKDWIACMAVLPEPGSNQEKKVNGLNEHIGDNERAMRDADPQRYWDKYKYKVATGEEVSGSVYADMAGRHVLGKQIRDDISLIDQWANDTSEKAALRPTLVFNGTEYDMATMPNDRRDTMRKTLNARFNRLVDNFRTMAAVHFNKMDIEERMKDAVEVEFVYKVEDMPASGLADIKEPIRLIALIAEPSHPRFGQQSKTSRTYAAKPFANLSVDGAIHKAGEGKKPSFANLIDSKKIKLKIGAQHSTKEAGKVVVEAMVSSSNFRVVALNQQNYVENFDTLADAAASIWKKFKETEKSEQPEFADTLVTVRNLFNAIVTPEMEALAKVQTTIQREKAKADMEAAAKAAAERAELETQPSQNERNARARDEEAERVARAMGNQTTTDKIDDAIEALKSAESVNVQAVGSALQSTRSRNRSRAR